MVLTYALPTNIRPRPVTYGGYSDSIVVDESFVLRMPRQPQPRGGRAAPLCRHHDVFADAALGRREG
jgi:uncharacterized zinc-type alcohol dehydrogenase-like protein